MPTPETAPSAAIRTALLAEMVKIAGETGWTEQAMASAAEAAELSAQDVALGVPGGLPELVKAYFDQSKAAVIDAFETHKEFEALKIRQKVTLGVAVWLETLNQHHAASCKALDWCTVRPLGGLPMTELIWSVADTIWSGLGDMDTGFTYMSKRTILSGVVGSTLAVWRTSYGTREEWEPFLERRIENVMTFEKWKAKLNPFAA